MLQRLQAPPDICRVFARTTNTTRYDITMFVRTTNHKGLPRFVHDSSKYLTRGQNGGKEG